MALVGAAKPRRQQIPIKGFYKGRSVALGYRQRSSPEDRLRTEELRHLP
jgi:hypothetical protein